MLNDNIKAIVHSLLNLPKIKAVGEIWLFNKYLHRGVSEGIQLTNLRWQLETAKLFRLAVFRGHLAFAKGISHPSASFYWHSGICNAVNGRIPILEVWHCQFNK